MINKYFDGEIQSGDVHGDFDDDLKAVATGAIDKIIKKMNTLHVADSMDEIWKVVDRANKYIDETTPWVLAKMKMISQDWVQCFIILLKQSELLRHC